MTSNSDKNWNRPWSMEEIIENSETWSLAGDVALLNSIKAFADNMLTRTVAISDSVDDLLNNLSEVSLKLDISQNEFQSLRNTQFIESRVYEDDETLDSMQEVKVEEKEPSEEEKEKMIKESILEGLAVVEKYFDKIEVSISDSEEESEKSYVLQATDLYADRSLPLIIGTEEWYKKWHVGLADSSSDSETENVTETYSDSDSEDDLPKDMLKGSYTSSELDFSSQASENRPAANSTFNDSTKKPDIFASDEESDEQGSLPVKTPISNKTFAEELAAKLGNVISEREDIPEQINRKPIQPAQTSKFVGDLFSDEPPPLDDLEDTILPKSVQSGLFSGGQGLFDDNEDELFWGQDKTQNTKPEEDKSFKVKDKPEIVPAIQDTIKNATLLPKSSQVSKGLFDSDDSSDDDIFAANRKQLAKQPFLKPYNTTAPLFDEKPPELDKQKKTTDELTKKKPVGGVSIFGTSNLFGDQKIENILKSQPKTVQGDESVTANRTKFTQENVLDEKNVNSKKISLFDDEIDNPVIAPLIKPEVTGKTKKISLFDDDDDLFKDDLFSNITSKKPMSNLFDDQEGNEDLFDTNVKNNNTPNVHLFADLDNVKHHNETISNKNKTEQKPEEQGLNRPKKILSLFSDNEEEEDIFGKKPNVSVDKESRTDVANNNAVNVAREKENDDLTTKEGTEKNVSESNTTILQRQVIGAEKRVQKGLFDNEDDLAGDLFKDINVSKTENKADLFENKLTTESDRDTASSPPRVQKLDSEPPVLQVTSPTPKASNVTRKLQEKSAISLFGSSPPPPDDDWDTKSDNFSDNEEQFSYRIDDHSGGLSVFDNEPPSLGPNESSGIVGDYNTRVDTDDSSFYPYASSSRRFSSDIYNEQQSQDSFFVTKNKTESISDTPQLGIIPEDTKSSVLNITPSGNVEDLEETKEHNSTTTDNSSTFNQNPPDKPKKPVSLFDDDYTGNLDSDDLFSFPSQAKNLPKLSEKRLSLFDNLDDILDEKNMKSKGPPLNKDNPRKSEPHVTVPEATNTAGGGDCVQPTDSDVKSKVANIAGQLKSEFDKEAPKAPSGSPGKLKHNLTINVNALMPGYAPPKLRDMPKSQSLDLATEQGTMPTNLSNPDVSFVTPGLRSRLKETGGLSSEKAVSFGDALDNVEVLHSVTKDRAKIPIKRRPSTRRGRRQAISRSEADVSQENEGEIDPTQLKTPDVENKVEESGRTMETEPVTKDLPATAAKESPSVFEPPNVSLKEPEMTDIFHDHKNDALFPSLPGKTVIVSNKSKSSIFDSADSDSELFGPSNVKKSKTDSTSKVKSDMSKKSLFNDSSSDDDLFSTSTSSRRKEHVVKPAIQKTSALRKLENIEAEDDPLSSLLK